MCILNLQAVVGQAGLHITYLGPPRHEVDPVRSMASNASDTAPVYRDTGDPATDNANYEAAKASWIAAHQGMYESTTAPVEPE